MGRTEIVDTAVVPGRHWTGIALLAVAGVACNRLGELDRAAVDAFFDPVARVFPWRDHWLLAGLLHDGLKRVAVALWLVLAACWARAAWRRDASIRRPLAFTLLASLGAALLVSVVKGASAHACPWDLAVYGGQAPYFRLLDPVPEGAGPGRCLPSGHASTGFMWIAAVLACGRWRPRWQAPVLGAVLVAGLAAGVAQVMRGAHFPSHVLLAAALCWAFCAACLRLWPGTGNTDSVGEPVTTGGTGR